MSGGGINPAPHSPPSTAPLFTTQDLDFWFELILNENGSPLASKLRKLYFNNIEVFGNLDIAVELYKRYRDHPDYIILYNLDTKQYLAIKSAKRGNDVYLYRIRKRLQPILDKLRGNNVIFAHNDRHRIYTTYFLFVNLTFDCSPKETYEKAKGIKEFMDLLRKIFGKVYIVAWGLDIQSSNKLHYDAVIYVPKGVKVRWWYSEHRKKHILVLVDQKLFDEIKSKWKHGFINVEGVSSLKEALEYCLKYVLSSAQNELLNTIAILYRKRTFYIATHKVLNLIFEHFGVDMRLDPHMNKCDQSPYIWVGLYPAWRWGLDSSKWWIWFDDLPPDLLL